MSVRGIRGAITVDANDGQQIAGATLEMMKDLVTQNELDPADICSVLITVTNDLNETFPAQSIRQLEGWELVPLMCALEVPVKGSLERCIRVMVLANTEKTQADIRHVYLRGAQALRPDLSKSK
ncbi:chorismate mutase [Paenibacillus sp. 1011MAR3C5]|uniref:chorismate mutase n=1 Tax=Paenibacillus sp. 1011MAR3C5 TaxID=1675787 RepID=UPI000E6B6A8C|nr:chorismate mutase [Paenibacillus sp. 1011MAR3C5]RJE90047.1 chorismate mutase [Paenibacillus sp. 1011MAR3C5]